MRTTVRCLALLVALASVAGFGRLSSEAHVAAAADHPSFAGSWTSASPREELRITQDASRITVGRTRGRVEDALVYRLDGSESRNESRTVTGEKWTHVSRARWVGAALVVTTTTTRESTGRSWDWMTTYFVTSDGQLSVATLDGVLTSDQAMDLRTTVFGKQ